MVKKKSDPDSTGFKLVDFPEEVERINHQKVSIYGEVSYENQMAVMSHYLHNHQDGIGEERKEEIILAVREFLERKNFRHGNDAELTDEQIWMAAESPLEYDLFHDFFDVPFPAPDNPKFTFIDLFAGIGGFRIAMMEKCPLAI